MGGESIPSCTWTSTPSFSGSRFLRYFFWPKTSGIPRRLQVERRKYRSVSAEKRESQAISLRDRHLASTPIVQLGAAISIAGKDQSRNCCRRGKERETTIKTERLGLIKYYRSRLHAKVALLGARIIVDYSKFQRGAKFIGSRCDCGGFIHEPN